MSSAQLDSATSEAYRRCETITRANAANFYWGIRLLAPERRRAMCAVYAFARRVDDIGDGSLPRGEKLRLLDAEERALCELHARAALQTAERDPVLLALADAREHFSLPAAALAELIAGVRMDVEEVSYEGFEDLVLYCRRVAGAIGRVCLAIFGIPRRDAGRVLEFEALADDLGVALQLTNILRDVREDAENGRVYLPAEDLRRFGLIEAGREQEAPTVLASLARRLADPGPAGRGQDERELASRLSALVRFEAARAQEWFVRGTALVPLLDRRSAACVLAMANIYHRVLERIADEPERVLRERVSLPVVEKAWVAVRSMAASGHGRGRSVLPTDRAIGASG